MGKDLIAMKPNKKTREKGVRRTRRDPIGYDRIILKTISELKKELQDVE